MTQHAKLSVQQESQTYIGKYGCHTEYYQLKSCLETQTIAGKTVGLCEPLYDNIGECIVKSFRETDG